MQLQIITVKTLGKRITGRLTYAHNSKLDHWSAHINMYNSKCTMRRQSTGMSSDLLTQFSLNKVLFYTNFSKN